MNKTDRLIRWNEMVESYSEWLQDATRRSGRNPDPEMDLLQPFVALKLLGFRVQQVGVGSMAHLTGHDVIGFVFYSSPYLEISLRETRDQSDLISPYRFDNERLAGLVEQFCYDRAILNRADTVHVISGNFVGAIHLTFARKRSVRDDHYFTPDEATQLRLHDLDSMNAFGDWLRDRWLNGED